MSRRWNTGARIGIPQQLATVDGICCGRSSARRGVRHARLEPALGDCKKPRGFARGKGFVKTEYSAVAAVALGTMDREGCAKAATVGLVCRGRNDVLAHWNGDVWNLIHSGSQALSSLRWASRNSVGCSSTDQQGDKGRKTRPAGADRRLWAGVAPLTIKRRECNNRNYITALHLRGPLYSNWA